MNPSIYKAQRFLKIVTSNGYEAYLVGSATIAYLLHKPITDIDVTTNMPYSKAQHLFHIIETNQQFLTYKVKFDGQIFEIAQFRTEIYQKPFYPKVTPTLSLKEDLMRRDITINTILLDKNLTTIDPCHAMKDLEQKLIKIQGNQSLKIKDDPTRIIRAVRFSQKYQFKFEQTTSQNLLKYIDKLDEIPHSLQKKELAKITPPLSLNKIKKIIKGQHEPRIHLK